MTDPQSIYAVLLKAAKQLGSVCLLVYRYRIEFLKTLKKWNRSELEAPIYKSYESFISVTLNIIK